ncbi:hypothetical protein [Helcococcus kunzii]
MNIERTRKYYRELDTQELCDCNYCLNYYEEIEKEYPELSKYLDKIGIDIKKPHETMPLDVDEEGFIEYISAQYIVFGNISDFKSAMVNDVEINIAESYPDTDISEEHFVIETSMIKLKWIMD